MANPVLILHGWSDRYTSFRNLGERLSRTRRVEHVLLGAYESMQDDVTFDDLADGLQTRFRALGDVAPFSVDVIVHSTGGPVFRHWLNLHLRQACRNDLEKCPIRSVVMLAPANFGSRLAAQGKSTLAKIFKGGVANGFETGRRVLEGLELGSPDAWRIADGDLFGPQALYPCHPSKGPFVFVLCGTRTYGELKGLVARGANEDGSDGTIRAASASLNSIRFTADYTGIDFEAVRRGAGGARVDPDFTVTPHAHQGVAFALVPGVNHSEIVPGDKDGAYDRILQCLDVTTEQAYRDLAGNFEADNQRFHDAQRGRDDGVGRYQQFAVRVRDDMGNPVDDFRLDFHVVDPSITGAAWLADRTALDRLRHYQRFTERLQEGIIAHVQPHSTHPSHRTFYINLDRLEELQAELRRHSDKPFIALNIDAMGPTAELGYDTDLLRYMRLESESDDRGRAFTFFRANTTTLVDIRLQRVPSENIFKLWDLRKLPR